MTWLEIKGATQADIPRPIEIRHAAFSKHAPTAYSAQEVETLLGDVDERELAEMIKNHQLFVARKENRVVGLAGWAGARLRHVYVSPTQGRQGIATKLLGHAERDFQERTHAKEIKAGVALHAEPFYASNGYEVVGREEAWDGSEYLEMVKRF
ncbi:MAG: GNAT family N-acetyltransferase [Actinomycetota bacterium]